MHNFIGPNIFLFLKYGSGIMHCKVTEFIRILKKCGLSHIKWKLAVSVCACMNTVHTFIHEESLTANG